MKTISRMADEKSPSRISHRLFATSRSEMKYIMDEAAYYDLGRDFFDTDEEYYEYVEKRKALGFEVDDEEVDDEGYVEELWDDTEPEEEEEEPVQLMSAKTSNSKAAAIPAKKSKVETKFVNAGTKGIQSFFKFGKTMYVIQHFSDGVKVTKCAKRKISKASLKSINSDTAAIWNMKENDIVYDLK